jgi:hypothetical protein
MATPSAAITPIASSGSKAGWNGRDRNFDREFGVLRWQGGALLADHPGVDQIILPEQPLPPAHCYTLLMDLP